MERRRKVRLLIALIVGWYALGALLIGAGLHLSGDLARACFWAGLILGSGGAFYSWFFMFAWQRD